MNYQLINVYGTQDEERLEVFVITNICNVPWASTNLFTITNIQLCLDIQWDALCNSWNWSQYYLISFFPFWDSLQSADGLMDWELRWIPRKRTNPSHLRWDEFWMDRYWCNANISSSPINSTVFPFFCGEIYSWSRDCKELISLQCQLPIWVFPHFSSFLHCTIG